MSSDTFQLPSVCANGGFSGYLNFVTAQPILDESQERQLFSRFTEHNDLDAARKIVLSHLRFVVHIARGYLGYGLPMEDLVQEGNIGLMKSVKKFDPSQGVRLASFAVYWIKAEIHEFVIRNWKLVKVATTKAQRKLFFNLRRLNGKLGWMKADKVQSIADELGVSTDEVKVMESRMMQNDCSFDSSYGERNAESEEYNHAPSSILADDSNNPESVLIRHHNYGSKLAEAVSQLDCRSQQILKRRWLPTDGHKANLEELAAEYKVSAERIRQIEQAAMQKLKKYLNEE